MSDRLPSIQYSPPDRPSFFDLWFAGKEAPLPAPLACRDHSYQRLIVGLINGLLVDRPKPATLISVGAGTGAVEEQLGQTGIDVLATDIDRAAIRVCEARGLRTTQFDLLADDLATKFDVTYCDGVLGHLWTPQSDCLTAWQALAELTKPGGHAVVSNDLSDHDGQVQFRVRSSANAQFYRPPAGCYASDAQLTRRWQVASTSVYEYFRAGIVRRREVIVARLLMNERIEL